mmetsp:Transcript_927/g.2549  ORF Transcript_927/g.2549 Transcript_927/m.2549 type:complete len:114 (+) Transcript_927:46-387(+)
MGWVSTLRSGVVLALVLALLASSQQGQLLFCCGAEVLWKRWARGSTPEWLRAQCPRRGYCTALKRDALRTRWAYVLVGLFLAWRFGEHLLLLLEEMGVPLSWVERNFSRLRYR